MKKKTIAITALAFALCLACFGCAAQGSSSEQKIDASEAQVGSLVAVHQDMGTDITSLKEVSISECSQCHEWDSVVEKTTDYWEGLGQITDANPHDSHATNAFECADCHKMVETQENVCNQCHIFETPEDWVEKDKTTTNYGTTATESSY